MKSNSGGSAIANIISSEPHLDESQLLLTAVNNEDVTGLGAMLSSKLSRSSLPAAASLMQRAIEVRNVEVLRLLVNAMLEIGTPEMSALVAKGITEIAAQSWSSASNSTSSQTQLPQAVSNEWPMVKERVERAVKAFAAGEFVVVQDDWDRENEADIIVAAEMITVETMALLIRETSGIVCCPITGERAEQLELAQMVSSSSNTDHHGTAFTVTCDAAVGVSTGVSAADRCRTARLLADPSSMPSDFVRPGHMFPLRARAAGVLERSGHTEAAIDLCRLAGLNLCAVIGEMTNLDGTMSRTKDIMPFVARHEAELISVSDLKMYRSTMRL